MLVSVEEYLATTWRPDRDYLEGELVERNMGELSHGRLQMLIGAWLHRHEARWRIKGVTEVRLQISITAAALDLLLADNGRGIERKPNDHGGDGLRNMRQRAEELKAEFRIESSPGAGTRISVHYPWPPAN